MLLFAISSDLGNCSAQSVSCKGKKGELRPSATALQTPQLGDEGDTPACGIGELVILRDKDRRYIYIAFRIERSAAYVCREPGSEQRCGAILQTIYMKLYCGSF